MTPAAALALAPPGTAQAMGVRELADAPAAPAAALGDAAEAHRDQAPQGPPARDDDDEALVDRFRAGDHEAFAALVRRYRRPIWHLAQRYLRDASEADDLAQRAFVRAFEKIGGFRGQASFRTWLYRITVNLALNHLRDRARERPRDLAALEGAAPAAALAGRPVDEAAPGDPAEGRQEAARLRAAIALLPPKQRLVTELRVFEELPFREVALVADCSEDSAKANFQHALRRLRELLADGAPDAAPPAPRPPQIKEGPR